MCRRIRGGAQRSSEGVYRRYWRRTEHRAVAIHFFFAHDADIIDILARACDHRSLVDTRRSLAPAPTRPKARHWRAPCSIACRNGGVTTMVTTHHPELKALRRGDGQASATPASNLTWRRCSPTYRLIVGLPGRSNALAIADRLGLDAAGRRRRPRPGRDRRRWRLMTCWTRYNAPAPRSAGSTWSYSRDLERRQQTQQRDELASPPRQYRRRKARRHPRRPPSRRRRSGRHSIARAAQNAQSSCASAGMPAETLNALKAAADKMTNMDRDDRWMTATSTRRASKILIGCRAPATPSSLRRLMPKGVIAEHG